MDLHSQVHYLLLRHDVDVLLKELELDVLIVDMQLRQIQLHEVVTIPMVMLRLL